MLLLIYALVEGPDVGWGTARTIGELAGAAALLAAFALNERRHPNPLFPFSILRINGLAAADVTQVIAMAGFYAMFFFVTLYMQNVLAFSQLQAGAAYVPTALGVAISAGVCSQLFARTGTRPIIVAGALLDAAGVFWLSRIPVHGSYVSDLLPRLVIMSLGLGAVFVGVHDRRAGRRARRQGRARRRPDQRFDLLGGALGLAIFSAIATSRTHHLLAARAAPRRADLRLPTRAVRGSLFLLAAAVIAMRATNTRGEPAGRADGRPDPGGGERNGVSRGIRRRAGRRGVLSTARVARCVGPRARLGRSAPPSVLRPARRSRG